MTHDGFIWINPNLRVSTGAASAFRLCFTDHRLRDRAGLLERWREISDGYQISPDPTRLLAVSAARPDSDQCVVRMGALGAHGPTMPGALNNAKSSEDHAE